MWSTCVVLKLASPPYQILWIAAPYSSSRIAADVAEIVFAQPTPIASLTMSIRLTAF
jgi:hypothetical protein